MPTKMIAGYVALVSGLSFWLVFVLGRTGGATYSVRRLVEDTFADVNSTSSLLVLWAAALLSGLVLRNRAHKTALALALIAPACGITAFVTELWALQEGVAAFDFPEGEAIWIYMPRLTAASLALAVTLMGLSIQLLFSRGMSRVR